MNCHEVPPKSDHSRTYTVLPSVGNPLTVAEVESAYRTYRLVLPAPVDPTVSRYGVAPRPAVQTKVAAVPGKIEPGAGLVITAATGLAAVYV
ncbi:MAG: hypothetical protein DMD87_05310 [Candidatus Rokuibacteriota bacterium]|nr:MAG: hypothetical protein DMD87_05310 [Candidatus Rokubacteria bacterium]